MSSKKPTNLTASIAAKIKNWADANSQYMYTKSPIRIHIRSLAANFLMIYK
jgi:hypothetical protein